MKICFTNFALPPPPPKKKILHIFIVQYTEISLEKTIGATVILKETPTSIINCNFYLFVYFQKNELVTRYGVPVVSELLYIHTYIYICILVYIETHIKQINRIIIFFSQNN